MSENKNEVVKLNMLKKDIVGTVEKRLENLKNNNGFNVANNYSTSNALMSAWLQLQSITAKINGVYKPVLEACTRDSIANSLLDMVVQGITPAKKQCYFIAYAGKLSLQRSYFGDTAIMKRLNDVKSVNANIVYEKDTFSININKDGSKSIEHKTDFDSLDSKIVGAYCIINFVDDTNHIEVMSIEQIHKSWNQSKNSWEKPDKYGKFGPHINFPEEMAKRTVLRRACKMYINTSNDSDLIIDSFNRTTENESNNGKMIEDKTNEEVENNQASEILDIEIEEKIEEEVEEKKETIETTKENKKEDTECPF